MEKETESRISYAHHFPPLKFDKKERNGGEKRQISKRPFSNQSRLLQSIHPMPPTAMASTSLFLPTAAGASTARRRPFSSLRTPYQVPTARLHRAPRLAVVSAAASPASPASSSLDALIFDCDGVILESENLHRQAYNDAFAHFGVRCPPASADPLYWGEAFYDELQNRIGGGKPKMRWYVRKFDFLITDLLEALVSIACDDLAPFAGLMHCVTNALNSGNVLLMC